MVIIYPFYNYDCDCWNTIVVQADKMTALMYAVKHGARDVIRILVKHKANLLITDAVSNQFYSSIVMPSDWV